MKIELKSNRNWLIKAIIPLLVIPSFFAIVLSICLIVDYQAMKENIGVLISFIAAAICVIGLMLFFKFKKGSSFVFTENEITVYNRDGTLQDVIQVSDINKMFYYKFKWQHLITMFVGALMEGGVYKVHVREKNGNKHELGFIGVKDAKRLKEMYPDLLILNL